MTLDSTNEIINKMNMDNNSDPNPDTDTMADTDVKDTDVKDSENLTGGKKYKQTRGKRAKKGKKSKKVKKVKKVKKSKKTKKAKKAKKAKTAKRSGKKNYLSFCAMYAKKHGFPNARAVMKNPQCKAAFRAQ